MSRLPGDKFRRLAKKQIRSGRETMLGRFPDCSFFRCFPFFAEKVPNECFDAVPEYLYRKRASDKGGYDNLYDETAGSRVDIGDKTLLRHSGQNIEDLLSCCGINH
jgi:hypothetical protein